MYHLNTLCILLYTGRGSKGDGEERGTNPNDDNDTRPGRLSTLRSGKEKLWRTGIHSDVKVCIGDKTFNCHKTVLVASSAYFEAMFSSGMREAVSGEITFHDMDPDMMEHILEYIYTKKDFVSNENVISVLEVSLFLQIKPLAEKCEKVVLNQLTVENCLELWKFARIHNNETKEKGAFQMVLNNFAEVVKSDKSLTLTTDEMIQIVKDDNLNVSSEEIVINSVLRWAEKSKDMETRLDCVLPYTRLAHVSVKTLVALKSKSNSQVIQDKLEEALNYKSLPAKRQEMTTNTARFRNSFPFEEVMIIIADKGVPYRGIDYVWAYSFRQKKWFDIPEPPFYVSHCFATCCHGNDIYLTGGCSSILAGRVLKYSGVTNEWVTGSGALNESRCDFALAAFTDSIYAFGGEQQYYDNTLEIDPDDEPNRVLSSVEKFDIASDRWEVCKDLVKPTKHCSVVVSGRNVLIFGPFFDKRIIKGDDFKHALRCCFMYNTITNDCTLIRDLFDLTVYIQTVKVEKSVFMILGTGHIAQYSEDACTCFGEVKEIENFDYFKYGAVYHANNILVFGGSHLPEDNGPQPMTRRMISYNTETSEVSRYPVSLPETVNIHNAFVIAIDKKFLSREA